MNKGSIGSQQLLFTLFLDCLRHSLIANYLNTTAYIFVAGSLDLMHFFNLKKTILSKRAFYECPEINVGLAKQ